MTLQVDLLADTDAEEYADFLRSDSRNLIYCSFAYRNFLKRVLWQSESRYLVVRQGGAMVGALPLFIKKNSKHGNVINSLPFYGSHGGVLLREGLQNSGIATVLVNEYFAAIAEADAVAATLIDSPFQSNAAYLPQSRGQRLSDERIGQLTQLPPAAGSRASDEEALFALFHQKTRNSIRKGMKSALCVSHDGSTQSIEALAAMHRQNMAAVGGIAKAPEVFRAISESFEYDRDYRVYVARRDDSPIAALLVFYFNRSAEYFTPATNPEYRELQPMSLLIFHAMLEAIGRHCLYWNWGGTWKTQEGVYQFKRRWGTIERPYRYHVDVLQPSILALQRQQLLAEYPHFYVAPFDRLITST